MKNYLCALGFILLGINATAQIKNNKLGISAGFGFQQYNGDLGNGFYSFKTSSYGVGNINLTYYLSKSFDIGILGTAGDFGFCQTQEERNKEISFQERCTGCKDRVGKGNLNSRMVSGGFLVKYKLANDFFFRENSRLKPYIYAGAVLNHITDNMKMQCVKEGDYLSINAGVGLRFDINERVNIGYNIAIGSFTSDNVDFMTHGSKDQYMQNTLFLGFNLF